MRIHVATAGDEAHNDVQRRVFVDLAGADAAGEHKLEPDPSRADAILFVDLQQHPDDPFLTVLRRHQLARTYADKVFVYDERDFPFFSFPGIYVAGTPRMARRRPVVGGPYPELPSAPQSASAEPDLLFSFLGSLTHPVRRVVLGLTHERGIVEDAGGVQFFALRASGSDAELERARANYGDLIARSKFVLCPRGHSPSSFRLYETLAAGRVPVVISDDWLPPPRIDWDACSVRVRESEAQRVPELLQQVEDEWPRMAAAVREATARHLAHSRLWHHYATSIEVLRRQSGRPRTPWWAQSRVLHIRMRSMRGALRARAVGARRGATDR